MQLYFVGSQNLEHDRYMIDKSVHRLFSYAEKPQNKINMYMDCKSEIFIDSGAYSIAHNSKRAKGLSMDTYIDFINNNTRPKLYASFDVIPYPLDNETAIYSAEQSWKNYIYMLDRINEKDKLLPVYHYGENLKYLERILESKPKYMAFGGRNGVHTKYLYDSLDKFFDLIQRKHPTVKVHAFGITVLDILECYPFTSADSTSYQKSATMGAINVECLNKVIKISNQTIKDVNHFNNLPDHLKNLIIDEIEKYGYTLERLQNNTNQRINFNVDYFLRWQNSYQYKPRKIIKRTSLIKN